MEKRGGHLSRRKLSHDNLFGVRDDELGKGDVRVQTFGHFLDCGQRFGQHKNTGRQTKSVFGDQVDTILDHLGVIEFLDRELGEAFNHLLQAENQIVPLVEKTLITKPDHGVGQADRIPAGETDGKVGQKIHFPGTESSDHPEVDKGNPIARQDE